MKKGMMTLVMFLTLPMFAELSGNFTFSSNYIWRGMTQTMDDPGYSGGFDYSHESGFYAGTWGSNVAFGGAGLELDTYAGFTGTYKINKYAAVFIYSTQFLRRRKIIIRREPKPWNTHGRPVCSLKRRMTRMRRSGRR